MFEWKGWSELFCSRIIQFFVRNLVTHLIHKYPFYLYQHFDLFSYLINSKSWVKVRVTSTIRPLFHFSHVTQHHHDFSATRARHLTTLSAQHHQQKWILAALHIHRRTWILELPLGLQAGYVPGTWIVDRERSETGEVICDTSTLKM